MFEKPSLPFCELERSDASGDPCQIPRPPVQTLKLDRKFVAECHTKKGAGIIAEAIIDMANRLGLQTVAEGVEQEEQVKWLLRAGCEALQGYYFGKAVDPPEFQQRWLATAQVERYVD